MKKVVLAFSGGLDTSYCAIYLAKEMGLEVHAALANTGGFSPEELADRATSQRAGRQELCGARRGPGLLSARH